ncbi:GGDEF domain-containing protein [Clostridium pasteurianum]|uniref:GGDEF domain-containing protein n=1 Tax=Clostridium pasteurianum TaxID=1501 RepID=UPI00039A5072|nr:GGDEF domain-containing protein [Clostridium pasteurianum]
MNPLTGLPGNIIIDRVLNDTISYGREFCVLYFDLNNFKVYNDTYGFENGDKVIKFTANCIQNQINSSTTYNGFVGHVGGDDFVCVVETGYENCTDICKDFISVFDKEILNFFSEEDREKGYVIASDRNGSKNMFGLTSIAIAGIYGKFNSFSNSSEISKSVAAVKKEVKKEKKSHYIIKGIDVSSE